MLTRLQLKDLRKRIEDCAASEDEYVPNLEQIKNLCEQFKSVLEPEPTLIENLTGNFLVVGDLHGNFHDLNYIMKKYGEPSWKLKFLFLGDYVDRGFNSIETMLYLMCLKILYPQYVYMIRGNHEFFNICKVYGFWDECIERLGMSDGVFVFNHINQTFPYIPLAAILPNRIFAVHGGISSKIQTLEEIREIDRFSLTRDTQNQIASDLLWGDPRNLPEGVLTTPSERGLGENYSAKKAKEFLENNYLTAIIRAHEACQDGFANSLVDECGNVICWTVFSASNYCNMNNPAAIAHINTKGRVTFDRFDSTSNDVFEEEINECMIPLAIVQQYLLAHPSAFNNFLDPNNAILLL